MEIKTTVLTVQLRSKATKAAIAAKQFVVEDSIENFKFEWDLVKGYL